MPVLPISVAPGVAIPQRAAQLPDDSLVVIGSYALPFGPKDIRIEGIPNRGIPNVVQQVGIYADFLWSYGYLPCRYTLGGWAPNSDHGELATLFGQFADPDSIVKLLIPQMGVHDTVRLVIPTDHTNATDAPGEYDYVLQLASAHDATSDPELG